MHRLQQLAARATPGPVQRTEHPLRAVQRVVSVGGLRHTVRINEQPIAGVQLQLILPIPCALHTGQHEPVPIPEQLKRAALSHDGRVLVPGVGTFHAARGYFQNTQPHGDEHLRIVVLAQLAVHLFQHRLGGQAALRRRLQQRFGDHHKQCRRNALPGYVGHDQRQMVIIHQEEIVEIAAHLLGRGHGGVNIELMPLRERRENARQHGSLDMPGHVQLRADALLLRRNAAQIADILIQLRHHVLERLGQVLHLIPGVHIHPELRQALHFALHQSDGGPVQRAQRADQYPVHIVVIREDRHHQHRQRHTQRQHPELAYLLIDHVHGDVHTGQRHRRAGAVEDSHIGRGQIAVLLVVGDEDVLLGIHGEGLVHQLVAAAVIGIRIPQVTDAVLTGHARVPDVEHDLFLRHDHIEILQAQLFLCVQQVAVYLLVVVILFAGAVIPLHAVAVDKSGGHGGLTKGQLGIVFLHPRPVQPGDGRREDGHQHRRHDHQPQHQLGLQTHPPLFHTRTSLGWM